MDESPPPTPAFTRVVDDAPAGAPVLVMVHGATQDQRTFAEQVPILAPHLRLVLVDLPGHGGSSAHPGPYDFRTHTGAVLAALDALGIDRFGYFGTHTGAGVGLMLLARHPQRVSAAVLEGPVLPDAPLPSVVTAQSEARTVARIGGVAAARAHWFETSPFFRVMREQPERYRAAAQRAIIDEFNGSVWLDNSPARAQDFDLDEVTRAECPVLILNGANDVPDFLELAARLGARIPGARTLRLEGGGGFPHWEVPDAVNAALLQFLANSAVQRAANPPRAV